MFALTPFRGTIRCAEAFVKWAVRFIADEVQTHAAMRLETRYGNQPATIEYVRPRQRLTIRFRLASAGPQLSARNQSRLRLSGRAMNLSVCAMAGRRAREHETMGKRARRSQTRF